MNAHTLLSIKTFASLTNTAQSTLRYYDEIGLLVPVQRGDNNYRYYTPFQTITLNFIKILIDLKIPLAMIRDIANNRDPETLLDIFTRQENLLDEQFRQLQTAYSVIHTYRTNIKTGISGQIGEISVVELNETPIILGEIADFSGSKYFYGAFLKFYENADIRRINLNYPIGGFYENFEAFKAHPAEPTRFFSQDPSGPETRPAGQYLVTYKRGFYGELHDIAPQLEAYAEENDLTMLGPLYIVYLLDEVSVKDPNSYLSRISVSVRPRKLTSLY